MPALTLGLSLTLYVAHLVTPARLPCPSCVTRRCKSIGRLPPPARGLGPCAAHLIKAVAVDGEAVVPQLCDEALQQLQLLVCTHTYDQQPDGVKLVLQSIID